MNRKKKANQILTKKLKKSRAQNSSKPRYISKADRANGQNPAAKDVTE